MGIGMVLIVPEAQADKIVAAAVELGESAQVIGKIIEGPHDVQLKGIEE
jgi:phosphoribosylformylglycinamidine cyclo-ligase